MPSCELDDLAEGLVKAEIVENRRLGRVGFINDHNFNAILGRRRGITLETNAIDSIAKRLRPA